VLNIRAGPAATFADIGDVVKGQELDVWEVSALWWYRISQEGQKAEWISGNPSYTEKIV